MEYIKQFLTRENITLIIAVFGAFGTIVTWISNYCHARKNIDIQIIKIAHMENALMAYITIQNKSRLPISINCISAQIDGHSYSGFAVPPYTLNFKTYSADKITGTREYQSIPFPINLGSLSGTSGYIFFDTPKCDVESLSTPLTVLVSTNRGNLMKMKLPWAEWTDWYKMF